MTNPLAPRTSLDDLAALNAELAALVRARIPLEPELRRLAHQLPGGAGPLANRIATRMQGGSDLASAIAAEGESLPPVYRAAVTAGIESGELPTALEDIAESSERLASLRQTTGMSLILPVTIIVLASVLFAMVASATFTNMSWIAPEALEPYEQLARSPWVRWLLLVIVPVLAVLLPVLWWWFSYGAGTMSGSRWSWFRWFPGGRRLQQVSAAATLAEVLRMMVASGAPLPHALRVAADATSDRRYRRATHALAECCEQGADLAIDRTPRVASLIEQLPRLVRVALRYSGHRSLFTASLARASRTYHAEAESLSGVLADYVPALLTLSVAGTVTAAYAIGLMWPYTQMLYTMAGGMWK